jgi:hypothetical protein
MAVAEFPGSLDHDFSFIHIVSVSDDVHIIYMHKNESRGSRMSVLSRFGKFFHYSRSFKIFLKEPK